MRLTTTLFLSAGLLASLPAAGRAANPGALYQASSIQLGCNGRDTCTFVFPKVALGQILTISHVSCSVITPGFSNGVSRVILFSSQDNATKAYDVLLPTDVVVGGSNSEALLNAPTNFYVAGGFAPEIAVTAGSAIKSLSASPAACFVSGYTNPG